MIVLDASAIVDVLLDQQSSAWVLGQMAGEEVCAPAHQPAEVLSALARLVRSAVIDESTAASAMDEFCSLEQTLAPPTRDHLNRAFADRDRVRVLDGLYVALAADRQCPLITTDRRLVRCGADVEIPIPPSP